METTDISAPDDPRRFGGIARLYGEDGRARLAAARVCVVGIGGVGSWAAEGLARSGVGRLTLIDLDHVAESNINRQIHACDATLGQAKVEAMRERIAGYNPGCVVTVVDDFVTADNTTALLGAGFDYVIDAIDAVRVKVAMIAFCREAGVPVAGSLSPQTCAEFASVVEKAGVDFFVIRGTTVSAEHVSGRAEPLNLKRFIYELDVPVIVGGCATYQAALHLMRTGAAGVLVGFGGGAVSANRNTIGVHAPMATAIADVAEARRDYMDESGGRYVQVIADGGMGDSGSFIKAFALGADAVMLGSPLARAEEAPGKGMHWGAEARHQTLPRGFRTNVGTVGTLEDIMFGPSHNADGTTNYIGALRRAMATTGYVDLKSFQRCPVTVAPTR